MSDAKNTEVTNETVVTVATDEKPKRKWDLTTIIAVAGLAAFIIVAVLLAVLYFKHNKLKDEVVIERTSNENLKEENDRLNEQITVMNTENEELDKSLEKAFQGMAAREIVIDRLNKENETLKQIKAEVVALQKVSEGLTTSNKQLLEFQDRLKKLIDKKQYENQQLQDKIK